MSSQPASIESGSGAGGAIGFDVVLDAGLVLGGSLVATGSPADEMRRARLLHHAVEALADSTAHRAYQEPRAPFNRFAASTREMETTHARLHRGCALASTWDRRHVGAS
jgi:hypothetical protein